MDDPNDPNYPNSPDNLSWNWVEGGPKWRPFSGRQAWQRKGGLRVPRPPGPPPDPSKAEREQEGNAESRAERLHLAGMSNVGVIIMSVVLGAVVVALVVVLVTHH
jgi:hypothetical protein